MSKNNGKKVKINKSEIEKNPSSVSNFDKSVLSNYSKWREDYSTSNNETEKEKIDTDFTSHLINSEITDETFKSRSNSNANLIVNVDLKDEEPIDIPTEAVGNIENLENQEDVQNIENIEPAEEKEEILTETQRLRLIYGNVTPLYERRKLGQKFDKNKDKNDNVEVEKDLEVNSGENHQVEKSKKKKSDKKEEKVSKKNAKAEKKAKKELKEVPHEDNYQMPKVPKALKLLFAFSLVIGICIVSFFGFKAYYSLSVKFPSILEHIEKKDKSFYSSNIIYNGKENVTDSQVDSLIANLNENGDNLDIVKKWLKDDADNLKKDPNYVSTRPIRLQKFGKVMGIFDDYRIFVDPIKLKIEKSDKVETSIYLNEKEEPISVEEYSLFPGDYTVFYNDNGVKLKNVIKLFPTETNELVTITYGEDSDYEIANESIKLDVNAKDSNFRIVTRDDSSIIFVNDKNTGLTVKDYNSLSGTNIKQGDEIKVVTKMPWGYNISQGVKYNGERSLTVSNSLSDPKLLDVAIAKSLKLFKEDVYSRGSKDETVLTIMVDEALEYAKKRIQGLVSSNRNYLGGFVSMEFDLNSYEIRPYKDTYEMYIGGHLLVQETTYPNGSKAPQISTVEPKNEKIGIHFIFDNEKKDWYCNVWGFTTRYISRSNIKSIDISKDMIVR